MGLLRGCASSSITGGGGGGVFQHEGGGGVNPRGVGGVISTGGFTLRLTLLSVFLRNTLGKQRMFMTQIQLVKIS